MDGRREQFPCVPDFLIEITVYRCRIMPGGLFFLRIHHFGLADAPCDLLYIVHFPDLLQYHSLLYTFALLVAQVIVHIVQQGLLTAGFEQVRR